MAVAGRGGAIFDPSAALLWVDAAESLLCLAECSSALPCWTAQRNRPDSHFIDALFYFLQAALARSELKENLKPLTGFLSAEEPYISCFRSCWLGSEPKPPLQRGHGPEPEFAGFDSHQLKRSKSKYKNTHHHHHHHHSSYLCCSTICGHCVVTPQAWCNDDTGVRNLKRQKQIHTVLLSHRKSTPRCLRWLAVQLQAEQRKMWKLFLCCMSVFSCAV